MISNADIEQKAREFAISPIDVEKDYVYSWLLKAIFEQPALASRLVLKGGQAIRKAYLPSTRFSKDLDFSVPNDLDRALLERELRAACEKVTAATGIRFHEEVLTRDKDLAIPGVDAFEARLYFKGFYQESNLKLRAQLDITQFDRILLPVQSRQLIHPYPDARECTGMLRCHKLEETLLQAFDSHADDLKTILGIACLNLPEKAAKSASRQIDRTLEELVGRPFNQVRHHGASIEMKYCSTPVFTIYGYFVAAANSSGVIAPSEQAHGLSGSGWTFAVTIRRLLGQLIKVASLVERLVVFARASPTYSYFGEKEHQALLAVARWLAICPPYGFEREISEVVPAVAVKDGRPQVRLQTIKRLKPLESLRPARWGVTYTGDGKSRSFAVW